MKKQLLLLTHLLLTGTAFAQLQKGNGILDGNLSVDYTRQSYPFSNQDFSSVTTSWRPALAITAGRFWADNWLAGLSVSGTATLTRQNQEINPDRTLPTTLSSVGISPFVRRYWQVNAFYLFAGAGLSVGLLNNKQSYIDNQGQLIELEKKTSTLTINPRLEVGANYFLTNRLSLQMVASSSALPITTAGVSTGLVYWTGPGRNGNAAAESVNSQTDKGRWVLEGALSIITQKERQAADAIGYESGYTLYSFSPSAGFFVKKNTLIGLSLPVSYATNRFTVSNMTQGDVKTWSVGIAPYIQQYWLTTRLTPYTRVHVSYLHESSGDLTSNQLNGGVSLGLAYLAGQRFIIETSLANASITYIPAKRANSATEIKTWGGQLSAGLSGNFAIRYVL